MEVRDPETDETRGREEAEKELEQGRRQRHSPVHSFELTDGKKRALKREEGRRKGRKGRSARSEHVIV